MCYPPGMKRAAFLLLVFAAGCCSTAPLADFLDCVRPGRLPPAAGNVYGGVGPAPPPPTGEMAPSVPVMPSVPLPPDGR